MRIKILFIGVLLAAISFNTYAKKVEMSLAKKVAINFFYQKINQFDHSTNLSEIRIVDMQLVDQAYWIVNLKNGWVVVSADDVMTPVIGYNFSGEFPKKADQGYNLKSWMQYFTDQVNFIIANHVEASSQTTQEWTKYKTDDISSLNIKGVENEVVPLLSCTWNQDNPYNILCPEDEAGPGGHVYVGCVATAMSQIMYYWRYPNQGSGQHSYYDPPYGTLTANFGNSTYDWDAMQDNIVSSNPWEIAELGFHAAVSVDMSFSPDGSGSYSWDVPYALRNYFNYSNSAQYVEKSNYSFSTWESMIQSDLDQGHPLYYSGFSNAGGHAFVFDGYQGSNYYHINLGWSGSSNGYYTLQDVAGFSGGQGMVKGIVPNDSNYPYIASGQTVFTEFSGSFTDGSGPVENYPAGTSASWLIDPQTDIDSVKNITLEFKAFNTASSDKVRVYGGNSTDDELLGEFSGNEIPDVISWNGNQMLITFSSTGSSEGFRAEYRATTPTWCSGSQTFSEPHGTIDDGSEDFYYSNGTTCVYVIQNPEAVNITLEFTAFSTEAGKDKVQVYNGSNQLLGEYSGNDIPPVISEETGTMILVWSTNSSVRDAGWTAEYMVDGVGIQENTPFNKFVVYPNPSDGQINLDLNAEIKGKLEIKITNMSGQVVFDGSISDLSGSMKRSINMNEQPKGIYLLSIITDQGKYDKKVVLH